MKKRILAIGQANVDFVMKLSRFPEDGQTVVSDGNYAFVVQGKGSNYAVCAARLGADIVLCSKVGNDSFGTQLIEKLTRDGIDTRFIAKDKNEKTTLKVVNAGENGLNRTILFSGAYALLNTTDIENAFTCYPDAVLLALEGNSENIFFSAKKAKEQNALLFLDISTPVTDLFIEELQKAEIVMVNDDAAIQLTGVRPASSASCLRVCVDIMNKIECKYVILKLGERGCFVYDGTHCHHIAPVDAQIVDRTGAGDAFSAALTFRYMENGKNILDACEFANAVCAYVISKPGAHTSYPTKKLLEEFISSIGTNI